MVQTFLKCYKFSEGLRIKMHRVFFFFLSFSGKSSQLEIQIVRMKLKRSRGVKGQRSVEYGACRPKRGREGILGNARG